mmetsp:Transcript_74466/g.206816  ORF Transcript_74466/g.206816 Transcript_74466/m.206816 type:complete len:280 (+) Transcript_74466:161-1000(+)
MRKGIGNDGSRRAMRLAATRRFAVEATRRSREQIAPMIGKGSKRQVRSPPLATTAVAVATAVAAGGGPPHPNTICTAPAAAPSTPPAMIRMISSSSKTGWSRFSNSANESAWRRTVSVSCNPSLLFTYTCKGCVSGSEAIFLNAPIAAMVTSLGTSPGTDLVTISSKLCFKRPLAISSMSMGEDSTRCARNSEKSSDTSGCRFSKRPCITKGPTGVGSTGSKMSLIATQFVMYPTSAPPTGRTQLFGNTIQHAIWMMPSTNPKPKPESTRNFSSLRPAL